MAAERHHHEERNETRLERADRNFSELLQELRVTQTGVQILFAFLLTLAFTPRFPSLDAVQRTTYVVTLLLAVLAAALFTAPAALHRRLFRRGAKPQVVEASSRVAQIGLAVLALALSGSMLLVVDVAVDRAEGIAAGAVTLVVCTGLWEVMPYLVKRAADRSSSSDGDDSDDTNGRDGGSEEDDGADADGTAGADGGSGKDPV
ncbi:DUF6328 family protein [Streptomyces apricus]|uniref:DUF6328 family protein n=1 Tax=Streptomyces apricus TaxID=1828112 RepID=UPI001CAA8A39|nr:DUF6328 family protein [Streptomyces apricus]